MARNRYDTARMNGIEAAMTLHRVLGLRDRVITGAYGSVDIFAVIEELDIPFTFVKLDKALGFCLPHPQRGIVVSTEPSLHRQRFTAAHELGHAVLEHEGSIDVEILMRGGQMADSGKLQEVEAEAFAAEFLLPRWLLVHHMRKQGWTMIEHMIDHRFVYQLSLRVSASFEATCWSLFGHKLLPDRDALNKLLRAKRSLPSAKKEVVAPVDTTLGHGNALGLTEADNGGRFTVDVTDLLRIDLAERIGSGFVWDVSSVEDGGFAVEFDGYPASDSPGVGGDGMRRLVFSPFRGAERELLLSESRPWEGPLSSRNVFGVTLDSLGKETKGMSRARRRMLGLPVA